MALRMLIVMLLLCGVEARAAVRAVALETVEAIAAKADAIVIGRVVKQEKTTGGNRITILTIEVEQTLKGKASGTIQAIAWGDPDRRQNAKNRRLIWLTPAGPMLSGVQLSKQQQAVVPAIAHGAPEWSSANCIDLDNPDGIQRYIHTLAPQGVDQPLLMKPLKTPGAILAALQAELSRPMANHGILELQISPNSKAISVPEPRYGLHYLLMPIDQRLVEPARRWLESPDPFDRWNGAMILRNFKSDQNIAVMQKLLEDSFTAEDPWPHVSDFRMPTGYRKWAATPYPLRRMAYETLKSWEVSSGAVELASPAYPAKRVSAARIVTPVAALAIVAIAIVFTAWLWRGKFWAGVSAVSWLLLALTIALHARSKWTIDEIAWTDAQAQRWEIALLNGRVRVIRFDRYLESTPALYTTVARTEKTQSDWTPGSSWPAPLPGAFLRERMGFAHARDQIVGPGYVPWPFTLWAVPIWPAMVLFALLPAARLCAAVVRKARRVKGRCEKCGYDMRATPQRCPECGFESRM